MNRLVPALIARPDLVEDAAQGDTAEFGALLELLGDDLLSEAEWNSIPRDGGPGPSLLRSGYLPVVSWAEWAAALREADPGYGAGVLWRTVMAPGISDARGLTVPQDESREPLVALFSGPPDAPHVVAYDLSRRRFVDQAPEEHCLPPSRGRCAGGTCGGCRSIRLEDHQGRDSIACRCDDHG